MLLERQRETVDLFHPTCSASRELLISALNPQNVNCRPRLGIMGNWSTRLFVTRST